ncbi:hypothetical protein D770_03860 [Flammeovirgaceae bacterium 311]|nr:hypothetical protein D770_03860 [Flammeovirgaceae bacterium 311]
MYLQGKKILKYFERNPVVAPEGDTEGLVEKGTGELQLLVLGESTVEGIGADSFEKTLSVKLAETLARESGQSVSWKAVGKSGATAKTSLQHLLPLVPHLERYDITVLVLGANDSFALTSPLAWVKHIDGIVQKLRQKQPHALVYLASLPPVGSFPALPQPTRWVLGQCNRLLRLASKIYARDQQRVIHSQALFENRKHLLCSDGIHPSEQGYKKWAEAIAEELLPFMPDHSVQSSKVA